MANMVERLRAVIAKEFELGAKERTVYHFFLQGGSNFVGIIDGEYDPTEDCFQLFGGIPKPYGMEVNDDDVSMITLRLDAIISWNKIGAAPDLRTERPS